ncbi:jerky protein homolog-like [Trichonephila clavipes]|nr:jerky protein homolog-like [Trichonephila clavipes]
MFKYVSKNCHTSAASYSAANAIARHGKPFQEGEFLKEAWLACAPSLFDDFDNKDFKMTVATLLMFLAVYTASSSLDHYGAFWKSKLVILSYAWSSVEAIPPIEESTKLVRKQIVMASKRKHSTLTLKDELEVLKRLDKGEGVTKLATEFNVGKATICDWRKNRRKLEQYCANSSGETLENRQTAKQSLYDKVDNALHIWFTQERQRGTPLSGPIIQEKAIQLNKLMNGDASFSASIGWLDRWKKRHGVRQLTNTGEKLSSDFDAAKEYVTTFANLIAEGNYSPQQIYNADETGLNFRALPKKSLASQDEKSAPGYKMSKDRVTLMVCSNAFGNHKLPLMAIGKSAKPRAFKNVNMKSLPVSGAKNKSMDECNVV